MHINGQETGRQQYIKNKQIFHTNQLMIYKHSESSIPTLTVFLPGYMKLKIKNISKFDLNQQQMQINCTVSITIYYGDLPHQIRRYLQRNIYLIIQQDQAIRLGAHQIDQEIEFRQNQHQKQFNYVLRKNIPIRNIHTYLFLTPYQIIDGILTINVRVSPMYDNNPILHFKINLMDDGNNYNNKFVYTKEININNYGFAQKRRHVQFSRSAQPLSLINFNKNIYNCRCSINNQPDNDDQMIVGYNRNQNIQSYRFAHYHVPLYKFPTVTLGTIFLPLLILAGINISIFFQSSILSQRIANIAMLMIAFLALIPVVHSQMPLHQLTLLQLLVYLQISTTILCLIDSVIISQIPQDQYKFQPFSDGYFVVSLIISITIITIVIFLSLINLFIWNSQHRQNYKKFGKFIKRPVYRQNWNKNEACNQTFFYLSDELTLQFGNKDNFIQYIQKLKVNPVLSSFILRNTAQ